MKTVKQKQFLIVLASIIGFAFNVQAQDVEFTVSAPRVVEMGEQFRISYALNAKGSNFEEPEFKNFRILSGPNVSSSSSVQIINGKMSQSVSYTYTFIAMAISDGTFSLPPAKVEVKGKTYQSNSLSIEVVKGASASQNNQATGNTNVNKPSTSNDKVFVSVEVNKKDLYQGESLVVELKVYTKVDIAGFDEVKFPPYTGFWSQDIETPQQIQLQRENVGGQIYNAGLIKKMILFPQRSGDIEIDPFELTVVTQERIRSNNPFDDFFGGSSRRIPIKTVSKPVTIHVKPLPANKPADFSGAVGSYAMSATLDKSNVNANEAINLKVKISGTGNLKLIKPVKVDFPPDIDVYDPKTSLNSKVTVQGETGSVSFNYLFIPRFAGTYRIAPITFSYFDPQTKTYKTSTSQEFVIHVERGSGDQEMTSGVVQTLSKEDVKFIGQDIRFLKSNFELKRIESPWFGSLKFYLVYLFSLLLFVLIISIRYTQIKQNANQAKVKNRKANRISRKRLNVAAKFMKQNNAEKFYDEVLKAIWGYLSDKMAIPVSALSKDNVSEILLKHQVDADAIANLMDVLNSCEFARYAPSSVSGGMEEIYKKVGNLISKLDQKIKH
jgi:hypothetical protein